MLGEGEPAAGRLCSLEPDALSRFRAVARSLREVPTPASLELWSFVLFLEEFADMQLIPFSAAKRYRVPLLGRLAAVVRAVAERQG